ncbi:ATP-binding protein [Kushneria aurantia]|uniref:histidine kinase n=1 Tax=Kushneria aurantia TaxID=504092 RepID=A0ABV6G6A3_9GAMM|nr:ATP-binding protein [Kushneria aurantia]
MTSIRRYLTRAVLGLVLAGAIVAGAAAWLVTRHEMEEIFDAQLAQFGRILTAMLDIDMDASDYRELAERMSQPGHLARFYNMGDNIDPRAILPDSPDVQPRRYHHEERMLSLGFWNADGSPRMLSAEWNDSGPFPAPAHNGYRWVDYGGERWRVFSLFDSQHNVWVSTGLRSDFKQELANKILLGNSLPFLLIMPLLGMALWWVIRRGLRPIDRLSAEVARRYHQDLTRIEGTPPQELRGLRDSLNAFIERLRLTLERERRFTADAAHELRTPLAGLKVHIDNAGSAGDEEYRVSLDKAHSGIERLQRVVEQLLTLARVERDPPRRLEPVDLYPIATQLAGELWPLADQRRQQLEVSGCETLWVRAEPTELGVLIRNLVDNALRYTPDGGSVTLHLSRDEACATLSVLDNGPGVPEASLERITERFHRASHRTTGSGLGLAIVSELAQRQRATLSIVNRTPHGLAVRLSWPA